MSESAGDSILSSALEKVGDAGVRWATDKLQQLNLGDPSEYVLALVASAVVSGAQVIVARSDMGDFVLEHDGKAPSERELRFAVTGMGSPPSLAARFLATGMAASQKTEAGVLQVKTWHRDIGQGHDLEGSKLGKLAKPFDYGKGYSTQFRFKEQGKFRRVTKMAAGVGGQLPELRVIEERCCFAPVRIQVQGQPNLAQEYPESLLWFHLENSEIESFIPDQPTNAGVIRRRPSGGPFAGVIGISTEALEQPPLRLVFHGVAHPLPADLDFPGAYAVLSSPLLSMTPQLDGPHHDEKLDRLVSACRKRLADCVAEMFTARGDLPAHHRPAAASLFEILAQRTQDDDKRQAYLEACIEFRETARQSSEDETLRARLSLAKHHLKEGRREEALPHFNEIISKWEGIALNHLDKHRIDEALRKYTNIIELEERLYPPESPALAERLLTIAQISQDHRKPQAEAFYRKAVAALRTLGEGHQGELLKALHGLAGTVYRRKSLPEAEDLAKEALELATQLHGENKALVPYLKLVGKIVDAQGQYAAALEYEQKATLLKFKRR